MQITTLEQLDKVRPNDTLFLINPFGNGNQSKVAIEKFTVHAIWAEKFTGKIEFKSLDIERVDDHYFTDLLSNCKYAYTTEEEAIEKLKEVHDGLHAFEVKSHHDSCREEFRHFDMY